MSYTLAKTINVLSWDEATQQKAKKFWAKNGIKFTEESEHLLKGSRGDRLSNLISYNPRKVISTLTITNLEPTKIDCVLVVNTMGQHWTDWNKAFLELEMKTFQSYMLDDDELEALWKPFLRSYNFASLLWSFSYGIWGTRMTTEDRSKFQLDD